ncbi:serine proteinase [Ophiocordyceps sinensis CO18]|uniref:Serine proteinase n=1 Tax=Ophiocordyceps sinensis (strain Co18 / CGMCC 3.14243) TaxID=911162 RepID=T5A5M3_OPHSC|nr:serine proteinase [Ophiocordyceps sinensis CO18]
MMASNAVGSRAVTCRAAPSSHWLLALVVKGEAVLIDAQLVVNFGPRRSTTIPILDSQPSSWSFNSSLLHDSRQANSDVATMPGATCNVNAAAPQDASINVYFNTSSNTLGLQLRSPQASTGDVTLSWVPGQTAQQGFIVNPSHLASASFLGTNLVFGLTTIPPVSGKTSTQTNVSMLSPVYTPLASTDVGNGALAASYSPDAAWVYYLTGTDADSLQIQEVVLGDSTPHQYNDVLRILPGSSLAAYYNPASKSRFVIYQADSDSLLREYTVDGGGKFFTLRHGSRPSSTLTSAALFDFPDNPIANSTDASAKTALAVVLASGVTYVYYTHGSVLRRVARAESPEWGPSADVADAFPVAADRG